MQMYTNIPAHVPKNDTCTSTSTYNTYCLGNWNEENEKTKISNWRVVYFSLAFAKLLLAWMLYFHAWLQNNEKILSLE